MVLRDGEEWLKEEVHGVEATRGVRGQGWRRGFLGEPRSEHLIHAQAFHGCPVHASRCADGGLRRQVLLAFWCLGLYP